MAPGTVTCELERRISLKRRRAISSPPGRERAEPASTPDPVPGWALWAVVGAALAYYAAFIWSTTFVVDGKRYFSLLDDAMISMRYARNLAHGHGLVWNVGEPPIEGFSNPLWTLVMSLVHFVPLSSRFTPLVIQGLGVSILVALLFAMRGVCRGVAAAFSPTFVLVAAVLVAFYQPLVYWTLEGMEVGLLALCATAATAMLLTGRGLAGPYLVLGAGVFVRMDFALVVCALATGFAMLDRPRAVRHLGAGFATALVALGIQTLARYFYFHDLLPNTYYLKLTGYPLGLRIRRGAMVLIDTIRISKGLLVLLPFAGLVLARGEARRRLLVLVAPFVVLCAYSVWVGGDAWEGAIACNRYLSFGVPLLFVPAAWSIAVVASRLGGGTWLRPAAAVAMALAVILTVAPYRPTLMLVAPEYRGLNAENTALGVAAARLVRPGGSVVGVGVGAIGYHADRPIVDLLGKNDRHIARLPARVPVDPSRFVPGHMKWDYPYSIGELHPDVLAQLWWNPGEAESLLQADYVPVRLLVGGKALEMAARRSSPHVVWSEADTKAGGPQ